MPAVGRYVKMKARAGQGEAPAEVLLRVFGPHRPGDAVMDPDFWPA